MRERVLRGADIQPFKEGEPASSLAKADEVVVIVRMSKNDQTGKGKLKNHYETGDSVFCPVRALEAYEKQAPQRFGSGSAHLEPFFVWDTGEPIQREEVTDLVRWAVVAAGYNEGDAASHSLRKGGATAIYQGTGGNIEYTREFGGWASKSEAVKAYLYEGHEAQKGLSAKYAKGPCCCNHQQKD